MLKELVEDGRLTEHGLNTVMWASLRLNQARTGDKWWVYSAYYTSHIMAYVRWETRER